MEEEIEVSLIPEVFDKLFSIRTKKEVVKYCKSIQVNMSEFVELIMVWRILGLGYITKVRDFQANISFGKDDIDKIFSLKGSKGPGPLSKEGRKVVRKIEQRFKQRKYRVVHMFIFGPEWHCFFFDQRDAFPDGFWKPHWKEGGHMHYLSHLTTSHGAKKVWELMDDRYAKLPKSIHIRFTGRRRDNEDV